MSKVRRLIVTGSLPERNTPAERIATLDADVRDLTARMKATLTAKSAEHVVTGWTLDDDSWEAAMNGRTIILSVALRRPADG